MRENWESIRQIALSRIRPDEEETERVEKFYKGIEDGLTRRLRAAGFQAVAEAHGSIVRGTWLAEERDVDIFIILDPKYDRSALSSVLDVAKAYVGEGWVEAYAEHPYIRATVNGFNVEFVPCFRLDPKKGIISATDRTQLHTRFVNDHLRSDQQDEVRLLKSFMKGVQVYGAEVKVGGFSGYLCELLIINLGSFKNVLDNTSTWKGVEILGSTFGVEPEDLSVKFRGPLIVIDPVDLNRNVASAVSETSYWSFIAAARAFIRNPTTKFFFPENKRMESSRLLEIIRHREPSILFIVIEDSDVNVPDVLWGQLHKALRAVSNFIRKRGFPLIRSSAWSDESSKHVLIFELGAERIPSSVRLPGPPVGMAESCDRFLRTHHGVESTISGPWIEGRRWWVETRRTCPDIRSLMESALRDGGRGLGVPKKLSDDIVEKTIILMDEEIASHLNGDLASFLGRFMDGRPSWLN